jgi:CubicO group peptidase (beta-lactamase class C family)
MRLQTHRQREECVPSELTQQVRNWGKRTSVSGNLVVTVLTTLVIGSSAGLVTATETTSSGVERAITPSAAVDASSLGQARHERVTKVQPDEEQEGSRKTIVREADLPRSAPESVGMDGARLSRIADVVADGLRRERMPGCVVLVQRRGRIVFWEAYGQRQLQPEAQPMTIDTVFDLASLTKPIATATAFMTFVEKRSVQLHDPVVKYLPDFRAPGKESITVAQLLTHQSGLIPDNALRDYESGKEKAWENLFRLTPTVEPGSKFLYSDVGFLVLGRLVETLAGEDLHAYTQRVLFRPLGMTETGYLPSKELRMRSAATQQREDRWMRGEVHDPRAYLLGGIAGHAGLFSTARDLARYAQMMLNQGSWNQVRILEPQTVALMTTPVPVSAGTRGLGWDMRSPYSINRGDLFSDQAFGHGGFTGTSIWIDPDLELAVIFLSNRVHPDGKGQVNDLAGRIGTIAAAAIVPAR